MNVHPNMQALAIAWFNKEDWSQWCSIDPDFQPDYQYWLNRAETAFKQYETAGQRVQKVVIDPAEFLEWSSANGGKIDNQARSTFAVFKAIGNSASN